MKSNLSPKAETTSGMVLCPFCRSEASSRFELAHTIVWKCRASDCELLFADPQLGESELTHAYEKHYYPSNGNGAGASYENTPEEILQQTFREAHTRFGGLSGKRLLDFGCGVGRLCEIARQYGVHTTGIEADPSARQLAAKTAGMSVYGTLDELESAAPSAKFDIITMWDVIEHLREPWKDLEGLSRFLQPGGWLLLSTPNADCLRAHIERKRWGNVENPTHFYYFKRRSLRSVIERSGFSAIDEWRFAISYPGHSVVRRFVNRGLWSCGMQGQLLFVARPSQSS